MKARDLIRKYGWEIMPTLSNLGIQLLANGNVYFVDSNATNALDDNNDIAGNEWETPFATLNFAVSRCTASQGDIILVAEEHAETIEDTGTASGTTTDELVLDKAGITIIGMGNGERRPTFTFEGATDAAMVVIAADITVKNLILKGNLADLATLVDVSAAGDGLTLENCTFTDGGTAILETIHQIDLATTCHNVTIDNCKFFTTAAGSSTLANIEVATTCNNLTITNCWFKGDVNTDGMIDGSGGAGTNWYIADNVLDNLDAGAGKTIVLHASTTGFVGRNISHAGKDGTVPLTTAGVVVAQNYYSNAEGASAAILDPATDS
jgi:hypothetical protein